MKKRIIALLLAALFCALPLAGCSGFGQSDKTEAPTEVSTEEPTEEPTEPESTDPEPESTEPETTEPELKGLSETPLPIRTETKDYEIPADFKVGLICLHDENAAYDKNFMDAMNRVKADLGLSDDQVMIRSGVGEDADCYTTALQMADYGCDIVIADSFGHEPYMIAAAEARPDTHFCHISGTRAHTEGVANYHNAFAAIYEGRYLAGVVAGYKLNRMISEGKITADQAVIGYVGAFTYAEVISGLTSFYLGARSVCPSATMKVRFTGSWYDQGKEQNAANSLIERDNCVLISQHADSMGAPFECERQGVPNVSYNGSTYDACPETFLVSSAINWAPYYAFCIEKVVKGEDIPYDWCGGIAEGSVVISGINQDVVPEGTVEAVNAIVAQFRAGTLKVFATNTFTVGGETLTSYLADIDDDGTFTGDTEVICDGCFRESRYRSAPYFDLHIDGIEFVNVAY